MTLAAPAMAFVFGLCIGSFLNVCIHRLPLGQSIVRPRSHCPRCRKPIAAYDNIPLLSYLLLGGRCRHCRASISLLYPAVELFTGVTFVLVYLHYGISASGLKAALLASALIALSFIDLRHRLLPDAITFPGIAAGFLFSLWVGVNDGTAALLWGALGGTPLPSTVFSVADALLGALLGGGLLLGLGEVWYRLREVEGMGLGDVKLMAMVGLFFGLKLTVLSLLLGSLVGSLIGGGFMLATRKDSQYELPLGTFLGLAAWVVLFWGRPLVGAYLGLFR
jgi:leader peptidase (prepilin peptidase)/N-methyltransferase